MDATRFTDAAWGTLTTAAEGYPAFIPNPAPRQLPLSSEVIALLDEASSSLGELRGIGRRLQNPHLVVQPHLRREAILSSRIEGTQATMSDLMSYEAEQFQLVRARDTEEVANYVVALQTGLASLPKLPLSHRLVKDLHRTLMQGVRGRSRHPGEFRSYQNWIGGESGASATYVGPPVPAMHDLLNDLEVFFHDLTPRPLVQAAVIHYEFEAIHPFGDGNGRVGRLLIPLFLAERGILPQPLLYLSAYFERRRTEYYDLLMRVSTHGDWDGWLRFFLEGVRVQAREAATLVDRLLALQERYREELQSHRRTANALTLVDALFATPRTTSRRVQRLLGVSAPTARATLQVLEDHGIVQEITGGRYRRIYEAGEIADLLRG